MSTVNEAAELFPNETETASPAKKNDNRKAALVRQIRKFGEEAALGKDSLPKLAHAAVKAAADGVVTGADAKALYDSYAASETNKLFHERSSGGNKANVSKLKQLLDMGTMQNIDAVGVMQSAFEVLTTVQGMKDVKVKSAYPFYVDVARAQQKLDRELTKEELRDLAEKPGAAEKTLEGELKRILKTLDGLISGENNHGLHDDSESTEAAYHLLNDRLKEIIGSPEGN